MSPGINKLKILNDPVHGFIKIPFEFIYDLIEDPWFQRLRFIRQLGLTDLVYPGATHSRFIHSIGTLYLMDQALNTLMSKGVDISEQEYEAALIAILCHDLGHGPFSHSLEFNFSGAVSHEMISQTVMGLLNEKYKGRLTMAMKMFGGKYERDFFNSLISSQVDMDRLDYLVRDSFFTGVIEGSVGSDRIISMLNVVDDKLVVEEKGVYSIEKFLIARRFMYWQVYMHKTVLAADQLLRRTIERARKLLNDGRNIKSAVSVDYFLKAGYDNKLQSDKDINKFTEMFFRLDDNELVSSVRGWIDSGDSILSDLALSFIYRRLPAIELSESPVNSKKRDRIIEILSKKDDFRIGDIDSYVYTGCISNQTYAPAAPSVKILTREGSLRDLTELSGIVKHEALSKDTKRHFLCYPKDIRDMAT